MHYSPTSTTYVTSANYGSQPTTLRLVGRGPSSQPPMPLSPLPSTYHGFHNMAPPQPPIYDHTAGWDRSQQPPNHTMSLYGNIVPLPPLGPAPAEINPLLEYAPVPMVDWDVTCPSSFAAMDARRQSARGRSLEEPATRPSFTSMTIRTPWSTRPIVIHHPYGDVITARNVLDSVHEHLRQCASELVHHPSRPITDLLAAHQQYGMASDTQFYDVVAQMLGRRTRWAGLAPSSKEPDVWVLHVK